MTRHRLLPNIAALALFSFLAAAAPAPAPAGPLTPPGPPAPTSVTLNELDAKLGVLDAAVADVGAAVAEVGARLDPRIVVNSLPGDAVGVHIIPASGSYILTDDVFGEPGKAGIIINANDVTLDLNGYRVVGSGGLTGITTGSAISNVTIRNGTVASWSAIGIAVIFGRATIENVTIRNNVNTGVSLATGSIVRNSVSDNNGNFGFNVAGDATFENCIASQNGSAGFTSQGGTYLNCVATGNGGGGFGAGGTLMNCVARANSIYGFNTGGGAIISGCVADENLHHGILASNQSTIRHNVCTGNGPGALTGNGIHVTATDVVIEDNHCNGNDIGISVTGSNNVVIRNTCRGNSGGNYSIVAGNSDAAVVTGSSAFTSTNAFANIAY